MLMPSAAKSVLSEKSRITEVGRMLVSAGLPLFSTATNNMSIGGNQGGTGGSSGGIGGNGGGFIALVCPSIVFTGTIDVSGAPGVNSPGNNQGGGGGGGGGIILL